MNRLCCILLLLVIAQATHSIKKKQHNGLRNLHRHTNAGPRSSVFASSNDDNHAKREDVKLEDVKLDKEFIERQVTLHNNYRKRHESDPLEYDEELSKQAQAAAEKEVEGEPSRKEEDQGENFGMKCAKKRGDEDLGDVDEEQMTHEMYENVCGKNGKGPYQFDGEKDKDYAKFTQLVWKGSKKIGIGKANNNGKDGVNCTVFIVRYLPAGNGDGDYKANVLEGKFDANAVCGVKENKKKEKEEKEEEKELDDDEVEEEDKVEENEKKSGIDSRLTMKKNGQQIQLYKKTV